jgi:hypothetical protein
MRRPIYLLAGLAALAAVAVALAWFLTPYAALRNLREAAAKRDAASVAEYVDWQALRSFAADRAKSCLSDLLGAPDSGTAGGALRGVVSAVSGVAVDRVVQQIVSPSVLTAFVAGDRWEATPAGSSGTSTPEPMPDWSVKWRGWARVDIRLGNGSGPLDRTLLSVRRDGLDWRIDRVLFDCPGRP